MPITRTAVVKAARAWVGTPFVHQGRIKGRGIDCVGLPLCVFEELGISGASQTPGSWTRKSEYTTYGPEPLRGKVFAGCVANLIQNPSGVYRPGDILSLRVPSEPCHVAFVSEVGGVLYMIHAYNGRTNSKCVEHILDDTWRRRIAAAFTIPGIED